MLRLTILFFLGLSFSNAWAEKIERKIISIGGDVTEIIFALGAGDEVIAVDTTSKWPEQVQDLPTVGYQRNLSAEGILSLKPTVLYVSDRAGPRTVMDQIKAAGVDVVEISAPSSLVGVREKIQKLGQLLQREVEAMAVIASFDEEVEALKVWRKNYPIQIRTLFVMTSSGNGITAGGKNTSADAAMALAGGVNVVDFNGYKTVSNESVLLARPEAVVAMHHTLMQAGGEEALAQLPAISMTPAGQNGNVYQVDGAALLGFGPRAAVEALRLAQALVGSRR